MYCFVGYIFSRKNSQMNSAENCVLLRAIKAIVPFGGFWKQGIWEILYLINRWFWSDIKELEWQIYQFKKKKGKFSIIICIIHVTIAQVRLIKLNRLERKVVSVSLATKIINSGQPDKQHLFPSICSVIKEKNKTHQEKQLQLNFLDK